VVKAIVVKNVKSGEMKEFETDGVFLFVGLTPRTQFLKGQVELDEAGYVLTDQDGKTSVKGVFAAGDCTKKLLRQVATAVGDGATAAFAAEKYIEESG
jgi:thioredoxin reductase (NADPH)